MRVSLFALALLLSGVAPALAQSNSPGPGGGSATPAIRPNPVVNRWYPIIDQGGSAGVSANTNPYAINTIYCTPFWLRYALHADQLAIDVSTAGTTNVQMAVYNDQIAAGIHQPSTLIVNTASVANTPAGVVSAAIGTGGVGIAIPQGLNWFCVNQGDGAMVLYITGASGLAISNLIGGPLPIRVTSNAGMGAQTFAQTFGTWPNLTAVTPTEVSGFSTAGGYHIATIP